MPTEKDYTELKAEIDAGIKENGNKEITPAIHNAIETDIAFSSVNKKTGGNVLLALLGLATYTAPTDDKHFTPKKYVDDLIGDVDISWADLTGSPSDNTDLTDYIESFGYLTELTAEDIFYRLDGDLPLEGDMYAGGFDIRDLDAIYDTSNIIAFSATDHSAYDDNGDISAKFRTGELYGNGGTAGSINYFARQRLNSSNIVVDDWESQTLKYLSGNSSLEWETGLMKASNGYFSYHYNNRMFYVELMASSVAALSYADPNFIQVLIGDLKINTAGKGIQIQDDDFPGTFVRIRYSTALGVYVEAA